MKTMKITAPQGFEIDKEKSTFEEIVFKPIVKKLPKSWNQLESFEGFSYKNGGIVTKKDYIPCVGTLEFFSTKEQAEASMALAQLSQLRKVYRGDWEPDWENAHENKYNIRACGNRIVRDTSFGYMYFLSFQSAEVRDLFLENFRDLIEKAKPLMS